MKTLKRLWRVCHALLNIFALGELVGIVGIFSNTDLTEKLVGMLSEELSKLRLTWQELRHPSNSYSAK